MRQVAQPPACSELGRLTPRHYADALGRLRARRPGAVLAVSGGRDSMVLLHAAAVGGERGRSSTLRRRPTFDHGTGPRRAARRRSWRERRASSACRSSADARACPGAARPSGARRAGRSSGKRRARWAPAVATAHTLADQLETVMIRALRGTARAGWPASTPNSPVSRPLLECGDGSIAAYANEHGIRLVEDPTNVSRRHLRNRVRLDLLPAMERRPSRISAAMLRSRAACRRAARRGGIVRLARGAGARE